LRQYAADAAINGLLYDRHAEETAVAMFVKSISAAADGYMENPLGSPQIINWNRVESALPNFLDELKEAVQLDNA
jgi:glucosyl-3-phosphoglycerate synthase